VGISLIAGIAIPAMVIGIPVYVGRKVKVAKHAVGAEGSELGAFSLLGASEQQLGLIGRVGLFIDPKFGYLF